MTTSNDRIAYRVIILTGEATAMAESNPNPNSTTSLEVAQLTKLELEIEALRSKNRFAASAVSFVPIITTLITLGGLVFTIHQFFVQQDKDRIARGQEQVIRDLNQIRSDIDQLLNMTSDKGQSAARVSFLIQDLSNLVERIPSEREKITVVLSEFIEQDADFDDLRGVRLALGVIIHWADYQEYLKKNPERNEFIIYKYCQALRHVHAEDPRYFESIRFEKGYGYRVPYFTENSRYLRFSGLVGAFSAHLEMFKESPEITIKAIRRFQESTNNPTLTSQLFGSTSTTLTVNPR